MMIVNINILKQEIVMTEAEEKVLVNEIMYRINRMACLTRGKPSRAYIYQTSLIRYLKKIAKQHGKELIQKMLIQDKDSNFDELLKYDINEDEEYKSYGNEKSNN